MASIVEICNGALAMLGDKSITDLDDETTNAKLCKIFWPLVRDYVLRSHPWKCVATRYECGLLAEEPEFGFSFKYQLPDDCLRVIGLEDDDAVWQVEGRFIYTDTSNGNIVYVKRTENTGLFDSMLTMVLMVKLAMTLASSITDKAIMIEGLEKLYDKWMGEARGVNAQEASNQALESNVLTEVR